VGKRAKQGVFCVEGEWEKNLTDRTTVIPLLELLSNLDLVKFARKDVATRGEFHLYVNRWLQRRYDQHDICYLAMHGDPGVIWAGDDAITLEDLAEMIGGRGHGRIMHFGTCSTLNVKPERIASFLSKTDLRAVCGYKADVDWIESAAFEILLLEALSRYKRIDAVLRSLDRDYPALVKRLKFTLHYPGRIV